MKNKKWWVGLILLLMALSGVFSLLTVDFPIPEETAKLLAERYSQFQIKLLILINPAILVIMAVLTGTLVYEKTNLKVPLIENAVEGSFSQSKFTSIAVAGISGGVISGLLIVGFAAMCEPFLPTSYIELNKEADLGILTRFLYGGITEEVMMRFGLMSLVAWVFTLMFKGLKTWMYLLSIFISAALFAVGHFPVVFSSVDDPSSFLFTYIFIGNVIGGLVFGYLYWKKGLESAMIAHIFTHIVMLILG